MWIREFSSFLAGVLLDCWEVASSPIFSTPCWIVRDNPIDSGITVAFLGSILHTQISLEKRVLLSCKVSKFILEFHHHRFFTVSVFNLISSLSKWKIYQENSEKCDSSDLGFFENKQEINRKLLVSKNYRLEPLKNTLLTKKCSTSFFFCGIGKFSETACCKNLKMYEIYPKAESFYYINYGSSKIVHFGILIHVSSWRQQKHQCLRFHYWDYLTNFWRYNWRSIIDVVERLGLNDI